MKRSDSNNQLSCDICYKDLKDKVSLECKHELCITCFLEITTSSSMTCHMCRRKYNWAKHVKETIEDTLSILIREDTDNQFLNLFRKDECKVFKVIINKQHMFHFIVILKNQIHIENLKFMISEFIADNLISNNIIESLRNSASQHFRNIDSHLESFYDKIVIKLFKIE